MTIEVTAVYSNGVLHLRQPLPIAEDQEVRLQIDPIPAAGPVGEELSLEEFKRILDEMAEDSPPDTPPLPEDFSRADCYGDRA